MKVLIGKSGNLNLILASVNGFFDKVCSVRNLNLDDISNAELIVWGGRYKPDIDFLNKFKDSEIIYTSTYFYNNFYDYYQMCKHRDENHLKKINCRIINIPFIDVLLPGNVKKLIKRKNNQQKGYYLYVTNIKYIEVSIKNNEYLKSDKIFLQLYTREKFLWFVFSKLYLFAGKITTKKWVFKLIKILEKTSLKLFFTHNLSCVYIGKENIK